MSKVRQIQEDLQKLSKEERLQVRDWLEDFLEDQTKFADEFEARIQRSERELVSGNNCRTRGERTQP